MVIFIGYCGDVSYIQCWLVFDSSNARRIAYVLARSKLDIDRLTELHGSVSALGGEKEPSKWNAI
jgi:hypothetical protein